MNQFTLLTGLTLATTWLSSSGATIVLANGLSTPLAVVNSDAKTTIAQNPETLLSANQKRQLNQLGIPIYIPTYLPTGFRLTKFDAGKEELRNGSYSYYSLLFQGNDNTCLEVSSGVDPAMSLGRLPKRSLKTSLGEVTVYSGTVEGRRLILAQIPSKQGHILRSGTVARPAEMKPDGTWKPAEWCQPVSTAEFNQALRSLKVMNR